LPDLHHVQQVSKEDKAQLAALEAAIAVEDKAIAKLQRDMAGLNAEAEAVAAALEAVGGEELKEQRALAESLQQVGVCVRKAALPSWKQWCSVKALQSKHNPEKPLLMRGVLQFVHAQQRASADASRWLQDIAAAEEEATRKGVTVAAATKSAAKLRRDVDKATAELEALEQREEEALERHEAAKAASFEHQEAMQVRILCPLLMLVCRSKWARHVCLLHCCI
jgi:hypothetical protein